MSFAGATTDAAPYTTGLASSEVPPCAVVAPAFLSQTQTTHMKKWSKKPLTFASRTVEPLSQWPTNALITSGCCRRGSTCQSVSRSVLKRNAVAVLLLSCLSLWPSSISAQSLVDNKLLSAVCQVESNGRATARGDVRAGKAQARGAFQFWRPTWDHTTALRRKAGLPTINYKDGSDHLLWSREYARTYLQYLEKYLRDRGVEYPTPGMLYAAYNVGPNGFRKRGFRLDRCPPHTQRAAQRINELCRKN